jgi:hypothetical protein
LNGQIRHNRHQLRRELLFATVRDGVARFAAWDDFNADGYADLAIGSPFQAVNGQNAAGEVRVLYGSASGLQVSNRQSCVQGSNGVGDFNHDGFADLAIGDRFQDSLSEQAT